MEEGRSDFKNFKLSGKEKRPLGRSRRRWEENIRMNLEEIGINTRNWVDSAQNRDYWNPCECGIEPPCSICHGLKTTYCKETFGKV